MFMIALFIIVPQQKQPLNRLLNKQTVMYPYYGILFGNENEAIIDACQQSGWISRKLAEYKKPTPRVIYCRIPFTQMCWYVNILEMEMDKWLPGVKKWAGMGANGCDYKKMILGFSVMMEVLYINTHILLMILYYRLYDIIIGRNWIKDTWHLQIITYDSIWIDNYSDTLNLTKK